MKTIDQIIDWFCYRFANDMFYDYRFVVCMCVRGHIQKKHQKYLDLLNHEHPIDHKSKYSHQFDIVI